jgi:hypothetical protein
MMPEQEVLKRVIRLDKAQVGNPFVLLAYIQ